MLIAVSFLIVSHADAGRGHDKHKKKYAKHTGSGGRHREYEHDDGHQQNARSSKTPAPAIHTTETLQVKVSIVGNSVGKADTKSIRPRNIGNSAKTQKI